MGKVIIENRASIPDEEAVRKALAVIEMGRISGEADKAQYCYFTKLCCSTGFCMVYAYLNKSSDRLVVTDYKER